MCVYVCVFKHFGVLHQDAPQSNTDDEERERQENLEWESVIGSYFNEKKPVTNRLLALSRTNCAQGSPLKKVSS